MRNCLQVHNELFDSDELNYGNVIRNISLDCLLLLSKLLNRKYEWVRSDSLIKSFAYISAENTQYVLCSAIKEALNLGIIDEFQNAYQSSTWFILQSCLNSGELKHIASQLSIPNAASSNKDECVQSIYKKCRMQKTVFGESLITRLVKLINQVVDSGSESIFDIGGNRSKYPGIIRLNPNVAVFIRRIQRLYSVGDNSLEWKSGSLATSVRIPNPNNADILTAFRKIRFPSYSTSKCGMLFVYGPDMETGSGLGLRRRAFHQWEAANELSSLYYEVCR